MANITAWQKPIEAALRAQADAQQAVPTKAYTLGQFEFLGLPSNCLASSAERRASNWADWLGAAKKWESNCTGQVSKPPASSYQNISAPS